MVGSRREALRSIRAIVCFGIVVLATAHAVAQDVPMLSRAALDSLVHPQLAPQGNKLLQAEKESIGLGVIGDEGIYRASFKLRNTSKDRITINALRSTCSCLVVKSSLESIAPNKEASIDVEYNPAGRSGKFSADLLVYSSIDELRPTLRLNLYGEIESSDEWSHLPESMGVLRLSRKNVRFDSNTLTERIAVANTSNRVVVLSYMPTIEGITLHTEPAQLAPNSEGDIVINYRPSGYLTQEIESMLIIDGCGTTHPTDRMIKITIKR